MIAATISGIPCLIACTYLFVQAPMGPRADSDQDCYGYSDVEFDVYDRKGYPAAWLERKMTDEDRDNIVTKILEASCDD